MTYRFRKFSSDNGFDDSDISRVICLPRLLSSDCGLALVDSLVLSATDDDSVELVTGLASAFCCGGDTI